MSDEIISDRPKLQFWVSAETETETEIGRNFGRNRNFKKLCKKVIFWLILSQNYMSLDIILKMGYLSGSKRIKQKNKQIIMIFQNEFLSFVMENCCKNFLGFGRNRNLADTGSFGRNCCRNLSFGRPLGGTHHFQQQNVDPLSKHWQKKKTREGRATEKK